MSTKKEWWEDWHYEVTQVDDMKIGTIWLPHGATWKVKSVDLLNERQQALFDALICALDQLQRNKEGKQS